MFWMFGAFIIGCGTTHLMEVVTTYTPVYRLAGVVKALTAGVSLATAVALVPLVPRALLLRGPTELEEEVGQRKQAQGVAERQAALLDLAHDGIFVRDLESRVIYWNRGAEAMYGWAKARALGQWTHQLLHTQFPRPLQDIEEEVFREGGWEGEVVQTRQDGSRVVVASRWALQRDGQGKPHAILEINRDITQRRQAEERAKASAAELRRSNRELEQFAAVASHDLQEPLRKIQAFGDRLQARFSEPLGEQGRQYIERMQSSAARMRTLIEDLLTYSRVTSKARPFGTVDLAREVRHVVSDLEGRIQQTGGRVEVGELPTLQADATQMRQLLQNLIGNALKFHKPGEPPVVKVNGRIADCGSSEQSAIRNPQSAIEITVRDNGIGFEEEYRDRIFQLFGRLHGRSEYEGTGIGLAVCKKIVERHGGTITAASAPGQGATFLISLPLRHAEEKGHHESTTEADHHPDGG